MRALLCPASLKGVLTARDAAAALARGARSAGADAVELPIADGGEGTAEALHAALGGEWRQAIVSDPLGRPISARWLLLPDGRAVVEAAAAIGLPLIADDERDPLVASSRGLGELVLAALHEQPRALLVGLGGSATVDGGAGLREVLRELSISTTVLCDVTTTLADAARVFGPQKGASEDDVAILERRLAGMDELLPYAGLPGAGAAGGLGAALAALGAELVPGAPAFSTWSASTTACVTASSRSRARVRSTRRRPRKGSGRRRNALRGDWRSLCRLRRPCAPSDRRRGDGQPLRRPVERRGRSRKLGRRLLG